MPVKIEFYRHLVSFDTLLVGTTRFELATPCTPCKCATGLRYVPKKLGCFATSTPWYRDGKSNRIFLFSGPDPKIYEVLYISSTRPVTFWKIRPCKGLPTEEFKNPIHETTTNCTLAQLFYT